MKIKLLLCLEDGDLKLFRTHGCSYKEVYEMKCIIFDLFFLLIGLTCGMVFMIYRCGYILENSKKKADKFLSFFELMDQWLSCKEQNYQFTKYFEENNIKSVAIYGIGKIGNHLKYELEKGGITLSYVIDEGEGVIYGKEEHYNLKDKLPMVDVVIVTSVNEYEEVKKRILDNNKMLHVISVGEVIGRKEEG